MKIKISCFVAVLLCALRITAMERSEQALKHEMVQLTNSFDALATTLKSQKVNVEEERSLPEITDDSLTAIYYSSEEPIVFYIPQEKLIDSSGEPINLKEFFEKYQLIGGSPLIPWKEDYWKKVYSSLQEVAEGHEGVSIDRLPGLLKDAKSILQSFLTGDESIPSNPQFIEKIKALNRLFTYAKLRRVIEEKKLSHIHLPLKFLAIKDKKTGNYLDKQTASKLLDDIIKIFVSVWFDPIRRLNAKVNYPILPDYELIVFSHKQINRGGKLSQVAFNELKELVAEAPFDVGYDNIFIDANGDAVIIDTEFKGEFAETSLAKLNRYSHF